MASKKMNKQTYIIIALSIALLVTIGMLAISVQSSKVSVSDANYIDQNSDQMYMNSEGMPATGGNPEAGVPFPPESFINESLEE